MSKAQRQIYQFDSYSLDAQGRVLLRDGAVVHLTPKAMDALFEKRLDGFGELFRMLSYQEVGSAAMMSRACAGTIGRSVVFALPGSENAVRLAMTKLILPEMGHIVRELRR